MKSQKIVLLGTLLVLLVLGNGCIPSTVIGDETKAASIVIQYSGGKEIGRWYLSGRGPATYNGGYQFWSGDTLITVSGDVRVMTTNLMWYQK